MMDKYSIKVKGLTKKFGSFTAVDNISFEVKEGEIFGFLGANGAGKTTAMRILCGLSRPTSGDGTVAGYDIRTQQEEIKKNIGYMSQKFSLYPDLKTRENIELYGGIYGLSDSQIASKTATMLKRLDMEEAANMFVRDMPLGWSDFFHNQCAQSLLRLALPARRVNTPSMSAAPKRSLSA